MYSRLLYRASLHGRGASVSVGATYPASRNPFSSQVPLVEYLKRKYRTRSPKRNEKKPMAEAPKRLIEEKSKGDGYVWWMYSGLWCAIAGCVALMAYEYEME